MEWDGLVPIPFIPYALLVCLTVDLLLIKTLSDSRFYVQLLLPWAVHPFWDGKTR